MSETNNNAAAKTTIKCTTEPPYTITFPDGKLRFQGANIGNVMAHFAFCLERADKLEAFKAYVHRRLDEAGIPTHPDGAHGKEGCRVGDRLDIALHMSEIETCPKCGIAFTAEVMPSGKPIWYCHKCTGMWSRPVTALPPVDAAAVAKGIAGMPTITRMRLAIAIDTLFTIEDGKGIAIIADILRPILPTPGAGAGTGTAMPKHIVTADGVSVAVGTVLYNHEGVAREHWIERRGEWRVETRWQHFTHGNRAAELYSTAEAAKQDWRNRSPGAGTGGEGAAPTQPPADDAHVAPGSRLFSNPNLIKPATPEQQELRAAREEIETLKQDVEKYRSDAMNCCNKLGQAMELAGERTKLTRWLAQGIASSGEQETVNRKIRRIEEEVFRLLSPAPKGEVQS